MARQTSNNAARNNNIPNENGHRFLNYSSNKHSTRKSSAKENPFNDDLIVSLADAYENKRARQVTEWERRQNVHYAL